MVSKTPTEKKPTTKRTTTKPRKTSSRSTRTAKNGRSSASRKKKPKHDFTKLFMWMRGIAFGVGLVLLVFAFYHFFISPYAYRWRAWRNCSGERMYGVCLPNRYGVHGFDISHHQGDIDWEQLQKTQQSPYPIRFVFMKASEGGNFSDTTFIRNFDNARKFGFIRGAYHFYNPNTDPVSQADFFIRSVKLEAGDLPPVLDVERAGSDESAFQKDLRVWLRQIERHYHVKPILYASYKFKLRHLNDSVFNSYPYWIAHYHTDSVKYEGDWKFWQHTEEGKLPGIKEYVDLNVFNGSLDELKQMTLK